MRQEDFRMKKLILIAIALMICGVGIARFSAQAGTSIIYSTQDATQAPAELRDRINQLSSPNAIERATAACQIANMAKRATAAIPQLIQLLGDSMPINTEI